MNELPDGWEETTLSEVGRWGSGGTPKRTNDAFYENGTIPWVIIGDLDDSVVIETKTLITEEALAQSSAKLVPQGAVLIAMYGSIGKLGITGRELATNQAIAFCVAHEGIDTQFLFWYLMSQRLYLAGAGKGATQKNISQTVLKTWPIRIAPLLEQQRIVAVIEELFTRLDAIEVVLERLLDRTDVLNISLSEQVLNKDWPIEKLEDIATLKAGPFGSALKKESYVSAGYKIYGQEQVLQNDPYYGDYFIDHEKYKELESCAIAPGDVLISLVGTIGKTLVVPDDAAAGIINPRLIRIRPDSAAVSSGYVSAFLEAPSTQARLFLQSHGGTMSILNSRMLKPLEVPLPPLVDQVRIVEDLDAAITQVESLKAAVQGLLERTGMFRLSVLAEAFAGRLVPQDSADEPASVLLERVRETVG